MRIIFQGLLISTISAFILTGCIENRSLLSLEEKLQSELDSLVITDSIPGATLSVNLPVGNLDISSGYSDEEEKTDMTVESVMMAGSVGKTFAAASVMKLIGENRLQPGTKASSVLLENNEWLSRVPNFLDVTIDMLLNHTSGIPRYVYEKELWHDLSLNPDKTWTNYDRMKYIFDDSALCDAGSCWAYSDVNYLILGMVIEELCDEDYYDYIKREFFERYNLTHTVPSDRRVIEGLAAGYTGMGEAFYLPAKMLVDGKYAFNPQMEWTGGGVATTSADLALWAKKLWSGEVLGPELTRIMTTAAPFDTYLPERAKYGYGVFIGRTGTVDYFGHTGFMPGYTTIVQYIPDYDFSLAIQFNSDFRPAPRSQLTFTNNVKRMVTDYLNELTKD